MKENDSTILQSVRTMTSQRGRVYYYQGNIYQPMSVHSMEISVVRKAVRQFMKDNRAMVDSDRADPDYKTVVEIFDEQMANA